MSYREARSLATLLAEINQAAPGRSKASDGWIGDAAHASRTSDHNPWVKDGAGVGVVRARDFTHDPVGGLDCEDLADALEAMLRDTVREHPALRSGAYVIWRRRIISRDRLAEGWRPYTGSNPHDKHLHLSVATAQAGYDSTAEWRVMVKPEPLKPETRNISALISHVDLARDAAKRVKEHGGKEPAEAARVLLRLLRTDDARDALTVLRKAEVKR